MALFDPTFVFGIIVLAYLSTFVFFAALRILTGVSIQRIGYFSLRRLAYTPKDGIALKIRGLGLHLHRPTFSQPTWISIVISELHVTVDLAELEGQKNSRPESADDAQGHPDKSGPKSLANDRPTTPLQRPRTRAHPSKQSRSQIWTKLMKIKEDLKRLHRNVEWIRLVDVVATDSTVNVVDVGKVQLGSFTVALDTRRRMVDRARFFFQTGADKQRQKQSAEWIATVRSVLFTAEGGESSEILDSATLNIHGFLYSQLDGLRDAAIALKLGRVHIPYDDVRSCTARLQRLKRQFSGPEPFKEAESLEVVAEKVLKEVDEPGSTDHDIIQAVSDSKELGASILRGIKEVQFAVSFVSLTKQVTSVRSTKSPTLLNASMKEVGIDLHRLDSKSPAHRMYFPSKDIAHEAQAVGLSIAVGLDDGSGKPERVLYIPMATTTLKTTLPSKTVELSGAGSPEERNANILFANAVVTEPSVDLDPKHIPILLAMLRRKPKSPKAQMQQRHMLISRLLPKANIKFSMQQPAIRIALPPVQKTEDPDDFDLIISSISSISLDVESFHSDTENLHYSLASSMRLQTHHLYYQTTQGNRFNLIDTESFDLKLQLSANPDVHVIANGHLQTFAIRMTRNEITDGIRQIIRQLKFDLEPDKLSASPKPQKPSNAMRALPPWLLHFTVQVDDFSAEVAGIDPSYPKSPRGVVLQIDSWSTEYRAQKMDHMKHRPSSRRRAASRAVMPDPEILNSVNSPPSRRRHHHHHQSGGDGRRLAIHLQGLEAFMMEGEEKFQLDPFVQMPRFEIALSTHSDGHGPVMHVHSHMRTLLVQYSLFRHYCIGVAVRTLRKAFMGGRRESQSDPTVSTPTTPATERLSPPSFSPDSPITEQMDPMSRSPKELVTVDIKAGLIQIKAEMPKDPLIMLQIHDIEAGRHRYSSPFFYSRLLRFYAEAPRMRNVWARVATIKTIRLDYREHRRKASSGVVQDEKMFDVVTDAVRLAVPHELIIHKISDNIINVIKATEQLHHRFRTGTNEYILDKKPEGPKNVPKVSLRTRTLMFELEDGAFEWKLGMIYRAGRVEQMQRLAREEAYRVKVKKLHEQEARKDGRLRNRSAMARGRGPSSHASAGRNGSVDERAQHSRNTRSVSEGPRGRAPRYDPDSVPAMSGSARLTIQEAKQKLHEHNAQSWRKRIDRHYLMAKNGMRELRATFFGHELLPDEIEEDEKILEIPERPALMGAIITDLHVQLDKPSFPMHQLPDFLHKVGKGMPKDMKYSLLIPMNVQINLSEAKVNLRDYPLPLLHVPGLKPGQSAKLAALSLKTDFVIAEEYRGSCSIRKMPVQITPKNELDTNMPRGGFAIDVRRTGGPVKSYSDISVDINTAYPTRITWAPSFQPAIQDMMMVIESFTKPQMDPSERVGFWDKIRLNFHSRVRVAWKGDGDVHLALKGNRDPYFVTGNGAGFLMCWRNNVRWNLHTDDDPKRFMIVDSGEYVLAVPDYSQTVRESERRVDENESMVSESSFKAGAQFKKVVMKLSGNVQWMAGLVFERGIENGERKFDFRPHYDVVLKSEEALKQAGDGPVYDAFRGFRSQHIHLSIAIKAPLDRDWASANPMSSKSYNTIHLTPRFFTHFFAWWSLFSGPMSLPIRQGALWPGRERNSKKFGRHLGTIKYNLLLAPLFLSHIYKHKDAEDYSENSVSATGIKVRFDSFMLDIHQRREQFNTRDNGRKTTTKTTGMKIHAAQLDLVSADVRAISASINGTTTEAIKKNSITTLIAQGEDDTTDLSNFTIPDRDYSWIDMDDFVELDWILPSEPNPDTKILPLGFAPRVTYFRQTDIGGTIDGDPDRTSPFGDEPTHMCIMSQDDDPRRVQSHLIKTRLDQLDSQISANIRDCGDAELRLIRTSGKDIDVKTEFESLSRHTHVLRDKQTFMESMLEQMAIRSPPNSHPGSEPATNDGSPNGSDARVKDGGSDIKIPSGAEFASDFKNRFVVHNMQLKWNNLLRNIILRYIHQVGQRRGFVYYLSRPAVKFILDIVEEQNKAKNSTKSPNNAAAPEAGTAKPASKAESKKGSKKKGKDMPDLNIEDPIREFLQDHGPVNRDAMEDVTGGLAEGFDPQSSYHVRLIAPQIQLQSEKNKKHVVLITAKGMELKVVEVMDKARLSDMVSGLVQRRFLLSMDSAQFFVTHQKWFSGQLLSMYSGNNYGTPAGSSWPPWVPMEVMYDFQSDPFGFKRVVQKTSALLRYDKYNTLRLKYNTEVTSDSTNNLSTETTDNQLDSLQVEFPQARALCNSSQYYAVYVIVLDLLLYSEPLEKTRSERLERLMLASDFSDLRGTPEMVTKLQDRIRQLEEIKAHFQIQSKYLDRKGWEDRLLLERDLAACEDELFFMMKAITTSQRKYDTSQSNALLKWTIQAREIVWHLVRDNNEPLVELQLKDTQYIRTDNSDGSHRNLMQVGKVLGLNLLPDAIYPEMVAPYFEDEKVIADLNKSEMINVYWHMLEAVAGIPVMDQFRVELFPMKIQLEREVGKKIMEYIFPSVKEDNGNGTDGDDYDTSYTSQNWSGDTEDDIVDDSKSVSSSRLNMGVSGAASEKESAFTTRAGSLELRLRPTLTSDMLTSDGSLQKPKPASTSAGDNHVFKLFTSKTAGKKPSYESLRSAGQPKPGIIRSATTASNNSDAKRSRFNMMGKKGNSEEDQPSDDLTKMMNRASEYMTFVQIVMPSVVLCLSYKGKGDRNWEDVHDFVFKLPTIEYRNKTWSNLDLIQGLKSHTIRALISHSGAIIGNKFSKHRPNTAQQNKLRELATSSVLLSTPNVSNSGDNSDDSSSVFGHSPVDFSRSPPRSLHGGSQSSGIPAPMHRSDSRSSSAASSRSYRPPVPGFLQMTPPTPVDRTQTTGLGIETANSRPASRQSTNNKLSTGTSNRLSLPRPGTAGSIQGDDTIKESRRKSGGQGGLRGKINALTSRLRESSDARSIQTEDNDDEDGEPRSLDRDTDRRQTWGGQAKSSG